MDTKKLEEQFRELFNNWKASLEELRVQFNLGKMDVKATPNLATKIE